MAIYDKNSLTALKTVGGLKVHRYEKSRIPFKKKNQTKNAL